MGRAYQHNVFEDTNGVRENNVTTTTMDLLREPVKDVRTSRVGLVAVVVVAPDYYLMRSRLTPYAINTVFGLKKPCATVRKGNRRNRA